MRSGGTSLFVGRLGFLFKVVSAGQNPSPFNSRSCQMNKIYRFSRSRNAPNLKNQSEIILKLLFRVVSSLSVPRSRVDPCELRFTQFNQSTNKHLSGTLGLFNSRVGFSEFTSVNCLAKRLNVERTQTPLGQKRFLFFQRTSPFSNIISPQIVRC